MALTSSFTLGAAVFPNHRDRFLHEGRLECLDLSPDADFLYLLKTDLLAAIAQLQSRFSRAEASFDNRLHFLRMLYTVIQFTTLTPMNAGILNEPSFHNVLWGIVLNPEFYDVRRKTRVHSKKADPEAEFEVDYVSLGTIYMAVYLLELFHRSLHVWCQRGYNMSMPEYMRFDEDAICDGAERFWKILWEQRVLFFRSCVMDQHIAMPDQTEPIPLRTVYAECLVEIAGVLKEINRMPRFGDMSALNAYFFSWMHLCPDRARQSRIFLEAYNEVRRQDIDQFHDWFRDAFAVPRLQADCAKAFRSSLLTRNLNDGMYAAVVNVFYLLSKQPRLRQCVYQDGHRYQPVLWIMKTLQRMLCASTEVSWQDHLVATALPGIAFWCDSVGLDFLEVVHFNVRIPLLPYLGRYALLVIKYPASNEDPFETFRRTMKPCINWLSRVLDDGHISFVPMAQSASVRRAWITTLRKLRAHRSSHFSSETISLWLALGKAHGFSERAETAWLTRGDNAQPSRHDGCWLVRGVGTSIIVVRSVKRELGERVTAFTALAVAQHHWHEALSEGRLVCAWRRRRFQKRYSSHASITGSMMHLFGSCDLFKAAH